jgi:hypothetical protein
MQQARFRNSSEDLICLRTWRTRPDGTVTSDDEIVRAGADSNPLLNTTKRFAVLNIDGQFGMFRSQPGTDRYYIWVDDDDRYGRDKYDITQHAGEGEGSHLFVLTKRTG